MCPPIAFCIVFIFVQVLKDFAHTIMGEGYPLGTAIKFVVDFSWKGFGDELEDFRKKSGELM
jgi:hypothetical protein